MSTLNIGRLALDSTDHRVQSVETSDDGISLSVRTHTPDLLADDNQELRNQLRSLVGEVVPVTWDEGSWDDGFYVVNSVRPRVTRPASVFDWSISFERLGSASEVEFESRLTGDGRNTDHSLSPERWHAAPVGHQSYFTGASSPSEMTRGDITVYRDVPSGANARWAVDPSDLYAGSVTIARPSDDFVYMGELHHLDPTDWQLGNELLEVTPNSSDPGRLEVTHDNATKTYIVRIGSTNQNAAWDAVSILRNDPEEVIIRLVRNQSLLSVLGRLTLDLSLRRGSRFVTGYLQRHVAATLRIRRATSETATAITGGIRASDNDGDGNRYVLGSALNHDNNLSVGEISLTSTRTFDFFIGSEVDGTSAQDGDAAADLVNQYVGMPAEATGVIRR